MSKANIFDVYFVSQYGASAEQVEELSNNFGAYDVFEALMKSKKENLKQDLSYHSFMEWEDLTSFELTKMFLIIPDLHEIFNDVTDEEFDMLFSKEDQTFLFAPHLHSTIALFVQKEINQDKLEQIKELCSKANMEVVYKKYDVDNYI